MVFFFIYFQVQNKGFSIQFNSIQEKQKRMEFQISICVPGSPARQSWQSRPWAAEPPSPPDTRRGLAQGCAARRRIPAPRTQPSCRRRRERTVNTTTKRREQNQTVGCLWIKHEAIIWQQPKRTAQDAATAAASCQFLVAFQVGNRVQHIQQHSDDTQVYSVFTGVCVPLVNVFLFLRKTEFCVFEAGLRQALLAVRTSSPGGANLGLYLLRKTTTQLGNKWLLIESMQKKICKI